VKHVLPGGRANVNRRSVNLNVPEAVLLGDFLTC
jgi:hypothetical protein